MDNHNESFGAWISAIAAIVCVVLLLVSLNVSAGLKQQNADLNAQVKALVLGTGYLGPSAQAIADLIVIPGVDVPEFKSDAKVSEVWDKLYEGDINTLEAKGLSVTLAELADQKDDELLDFLEDVYPGFDELVSFVEYVDDRDVEVLNLGLDDDEDKSVEVLLEYKLKYTLEEGEDDDYKDKVYVRSLVSYDDDEGYEAKLVYSL